jgi:hypothetical protein
VTAPETSRKVGREGRSLAISRAAFADMSASGVSRATRRVNRGSRFQLAVLRIADYTFKLFQNPVLREKGQCLSI